MQKFAARTLAGLTALATSMVALQIPMTPATAAPTSVTAFADFPSTITSKWSPEPDCGVYDTTDAAFDNHLIGARPAGARTPHCVGGSPRKRTNAVARTASGLTFTNRTRANSGLGNDFVYGVYVTDDTVYAATNGGGLSISTDGGATFDNRTNTNSQLGSDTVFRVYATDDTVYAATVGGLSISTDGGATFINRTNTNSRLGSDTVFGVYATEDTVYAATSNGLSISIDGGATFDNRTIANSRLGSNTVLGVYATDDTVYAATNGGLGISTDGGATFANRTNTNSGLGSDIVLGVIATGATVYAAVNGGVSISTDGGATFANRTIANGLGKDFVYGVYATDAHVYAATNDGGLSISSDGGANFTNYTSANSGLGSDVVMGVYATADIVYAATNAGGLSIGVAPQPAPTPVSPPSEPVSLTAIAGDASAVLTWIPPISAGSFSVSTYQAEVSPGGQSCLVTAPASTCTITGLANGTTYTATVRALNGAGWGPYSAGSTAFMPMQPATRTITITGTRSDVGGKPGVSVMGATTVFGMGAILRPWIRFPGQTTYTQGTASILIDSGGHFTWQRRTGKKIYVSIRSADGTVRSNRLIIRTT